MGHASKKMNSKRNFRHKRVTSTMQTKATMNTYIQINNNIQLNMRNSQNEHELINTQELIEKYRDLIIKRGVHPIFKDPKIQIKHNVLMKRKGI